MLPRADTRAADLLPTSMLLACTTVAGSFLLFLVQPMLARYLLPWFGGQPAVWTTVLLFFQAMVLAGYGYTHLLTRRFTLRAQIGVHAMLVLVALGLLPITPTEQWKPDGLGDPMLQILTVLTARVGLPVLLLAATAPLLQWWAQLASTASPYRLYAWSNGASLTALWCYPTLVEPLLGRNAQTLLWSWAFAGFALLMAASAYGMRRAAPHGDTAPRERTRAVSHATEPPSRTTRCLWVALPAASTLLLSATTHAVTLDVAPVPYLWVLLLSLYLLSFVVTFARREPSRPPLDGLLVIPGAALLCWATFTTAHRPLLMQLGTHATGFGLLCLALHGELVRLRPTARFLTGFYVAMAFGGALGSAFVVLLAPSLFSGITELPIGIVLATGILLGSRWRDPRAWPRRQSPWQTTLLVGGFAVFSLGILRAVRATDTQVLARHRSFYSVLRVVREDAGRPAPYLTLVNGRIDHGMQYLDPALKQRPTAYFAETSGLGLTFEHLPVPPGSRRIGMIGLGVGTAVSYCRSGDTFRIYELDATMATFVNAHFSYLREAACPVSIVPGDARVSLEREAAQRFDLLIVDAFSSDAIPVHLLTTEAFGTYLRHLAPDGVLLVHVSNRYVALPPVIRSVGRALSLQVAEITTPDDGYANWAATWMVVARNRRLLDMPTIDRARTHPIPVRGAALQPWTDDRASLLAVLREWPWANAEARADR